MYTKFFGMYGQKFNPYAHFHKHTPQQLPTSLRSFKRSEQISVSENITRFTAGKFCGCMRSGDRGYHPFPGNLMNR